MFKKKNLLTAIVACGVLSVALPGMSVMASDDNIPFAFRILPYQENGYAAEGRYRQTKSINNPWKVRMTKSTEDDGYGTYTDFWIENAEGTNVSTWVSVEDGEEEFCYVIPYETANQIDVYLTAENNNYSANTYTVYGDWDEEIW